MPGHSQPNSDEAILVDPRLAGRQQCFYCHPVEDRLDVCVRLISEFHTAVQLTQGVADTDADRPNADLDAENESGIVSDGNFGSWSAEAHGEDRVAFGDEAVSDKTIDHARDRGENETLDDLHPWKRALVPQQS